MPSLKDVSWRLSPTVIPLRSLDEARAAPNLSAESYPSQSADRKGRYCSAADYHALYSPGAATPVDVVKVILPIIDGHAGRTEHAIAWTDINETQVLEDAAISTQRWKDGKPLSVLDGVPFGVKSDIDVEGFVTSLGMNPDKSYSHFTKPATGTSWPVKKLRAAGAIMLGKMNMHEIGMDTTGGNHSTGTPVMWHNRAYYPGGSSSGAGSALSAGYIPIAVGTDAGGSVRIPMASNGVYGLKTSHDRTVTMGSSMCIIGPMAGTAADLKLAYRVMAQADPMDPVTSLFASSTIPPPLSAKVPRYLGVCEEWIARSTQQVQSVFYGSLQYFTQHLNYIIVPISLPYLREGQLAHSAICLTEAADDAKNRAGPGENWLHLVGHANRLALLAGAQVTAGDYLKFASLRQVIMSHLAWLFQKYPGMMIMTPTMPDAGYAKTPGDERYGFTDGNRSLRSMKYCWLANMSGCPAVTAPMGYIDAEAGEGDLPVGMMAMAEWGEEERLLAWAEEQERFLSEACQGGRRRPREGWVDVIELAKQEHDKHVLGCGK